MEAVAGAQSPMLGEVGAGAVLLCKDEGQWRFGLALDGRHRERTASCACDSGSLYGEEALGSAFRGSLRKPEVLEE